MHWFEASSEGKRKLVELAERFAARIKLQNEVVWLFPFPHLKMAQISGYHAHTREVDLVKYFLENAISLEQLIIDPSIEWIPETSGEIKRQQRAQIHAKQVLVNFIPAHVRLTVLGA